MTTGVAVPDVSGETEELLEKTLALCERVHGLAASLDDIEDLSGAVKREVHALAAPIKTPGRVISDIDAFARSVDTITKVLKFFSPFPVIGGLANTARTTLKTLSDSSLKPLQKTVHTLNEDVLKAIDAKIDELQSVFDSFETKAHEVAGFVAEMHATLVLMSKGIDVLYQLAHIYECEPAISEIEAIAKTIEDISADANARIDDLERTLGDLRTGSVTLVDIVTPVETELNTFNTKVVQPIGAAMSHLSGFNAFCAKGKKYLKPFEWALDALQWVMDKVLTPAINWVLDRIGLRGAANSLKKKLEDFLGLTEMKKRINAARDAAKDLAASVLGTAATALTDSLEVKGKLQVIVDRYSDATLQARMSGVAGAIAAAPEPS